MIYDINGVPLASVYAVDGTELDEAYNLDGEQIFPDTPPTPTPVWLDTAVVTALPSISVSGIKQGACTDGTYIYQIVFSSNQYTSGVFVKYKIADGTYTTTSFDNTIDFGHGNDMAYNPNNGHIYVATMKADGSVVELDTSFGYVTTHYLVNEQGETYWVWQLCFDRKTNRFLSADTAGMMVYNQNMEYLTYFSMPTHPSATGQGCETDGDYIFRITYNPNYVDVATITGEYVKTISLPVTGEPESIMYNWANGEYYIGRNVSSGLFSKVQLKA